MKNVKVFAERYIDWVIKLGRLKFSLLGFIVVGILAFCTQILLSLWITGEVNWQSVNFSILFGLISAPFVIYFFTVLVERLELSRQALQQTVVELRQEIKVRKIAEARLEQSNRNKSQLMATISHELRTPLNGIMGLSQILLDTKLTEVQQKYLKTIHTSANSLSHIFNDLIDLQKMDVSAIQLQVKDVFLPTLINDVEYLIRNMAEQKGLKFTIEIPENLPEWIKIDPIRVNQVLWNLLSNAVKFTEKGEVRLRLEQISSEQYQFIVEDTGLGIADEDLDKIFGMYYQGENKYKAVGSGIGLAISKNLAQLMSGDVQVKSELGKGTQFIFSFTATQGQSSIAKDAELVTRSFKVLLVEDIELNVVVARSLLEKLGAEVEVAMNGKQALQYFAQNQQSEQIYDLVFLDIQLPDMTGFDLATTWRTQYENDEIDCLPPLIALTANTMLTKREYEKKGMDDVLRKPLSFESLQHCVEDYLGFESEFNVTNEKLQKVTPHFEEDKVKVTAEAFSRLNITLLEELIAMLGVKFVENNLQLFKQSMLEYEKELQEALLIWQQNPTLENAKVLAEMAHKIKGATAAIGLKGIAEIAQQAQNEQGEKWQENIVQWVEEICQSWQKDIEILKDWLNSKERCIGQNSW